MSKFGTREDAKKQMSAMGLNAPYIGSKETRTEEEIAQDRKTLAENVPILGEAMLAKEIAGDVKDKDYLSAGLNTLALGVGAIPGVGKVANKPIRAAAKKLRKQDINEAEKLIDNTDKLQEWRDANKLLESQRQKNIPEAQQAAEDLFQGNITSKEARNRIKDVFPEPKLYTAETMPEMPTVTDVVGSMGKKAEKGILGIKGFDLAPGQRVGARLDIPAYNEYDKWVVSIHDGKSRNGSVVGYGQAIRLKNIEFGSDPKVALDIAKGKRVAKTTGEEKPMGKATIARVFGDYVPEDPYELQEFARKALADKNSGWTQVGMNPYRGSYFYDKATGTPVTRADEVIQVGPLVLAKNVTKSKMSELKEMFNTPAARTADGKLRVFNKGGEVPMNNMAKQMEMFDDGGLMDEGGTVDPVSGNDVPPGSTQEEVRDDIPAQLSEGEFVFPADVVRFIGLEKLMKIRQRAKAGLQRMEDMGQMGNSEEAVMPDDLPFSIEDLDMEDDGLEMAQGGVVQAANGTFVQPTPTTPNAGVFYNPASQPTTGVAAAPMQAASAGAAPNIGQAVPPVQAASAGQPTMFTNYQLPQAPVPVMTPPAQLPKFLGGVTPGVGGIDYVEEIYVNESGQTIKFRRYNDGTLRDAQGNIAVIPEGYTIKADADKKVTTDPTKVKTATVQQDEGNDTFEEDQAKMKQDQARVDAAKAIAKSMNPNQPPKFAGFVQGILSTFGLTTLPEGTINGIGFVSDGKGSLFDPLTGRTVPEGLKDALKNSWNEINSTLKGEDRMTRDLIARGKEQETDFGRDFYRAAGVAKVDRIFAGIKDDIKDGKYGNVDFDDFSDDYIDKVQKSIRAEAEKGNYITESGRIANPFEASGGRNRGDGRFDDEPPLGAESISVGMNEGQTSAPATQDYSYTSYEPGGGDEQNNDPDGGYDPGSDSFDSPSDFGGVSDTYGGGDYKGAFVGKAYKKNKLASQMKRSGLASKK